jgi:YfiH family protein
MSYEWSADNEYLTLPGLADAGAFHCFGSRRLTSAANLAPVRAVVKIRQVHGCEVVHVTDRIASEAPAGDALVTDCPGVLITVTTADCTPVLLLDPVRHAVAAIHAGWRGTVAGIVGKTVAAMVSLFGSDPKTLRAGIGPTIGPCCYEVGREVWEAAEQRFSYGHRAVHHDTEKPDSAHLDLPGLNTLQLIEAGLLPAQIHSSGLCTSCGQDDFYSYRRDRGLVGSLVSGISIRLPSNE